MKRAAALAFLLAVCGALSSAQDLDATTRAIITLAREARTYPNIVYTRVGGRELKLDVVAPKFEVQPRPTLIHIHGGGWVAGYKDSQMGALPYLIRGMTVVNVEYRLSNDASAPAAVEDCRCALRWVFRNAKQYGFDTTKLVVFGGSAGGHLSLMTGMVDASAGFDNVPCGWWPPQRVEMKVAAIMNQSGITDVADLLEGPNRQEFAVAWLGGVPNRMELAKRVSPLTWVRKGLPPILSIHGDLDDSVPYQHAVRLHEALKAVGVPNQLLTVPGLKHTGWTQPQYLKAQEVIYRFLEEHGVLSK